MAKVHQPSYAFLGHADMYHSAISDHDRALAGLSNSKPSGSREQATIRASNFDHGKQGKRNQDPEHEVGPSILRMRAAFLLELENTHLPAKSLRELEHSISPCIPGPSPFPNTGYHEFKFAKGDSRLRKNFLRQLEITNLEPKNLRRLANFMGPQPTIPTEEAAVPSTLSKLPAPPLTTMDPQEESSSAATRREETVHEDPEHLQIDDPDSRNASKSPCFKTHSTTQVCRTHELYYSSQYTRPATELLTEVLEERYPLQKTADGSGEDEALSGAIRGQECGWLLMFSRFLRRR